ncbi:MAG: hypothetical protein ACK50J_14215 [Planctomyces sp.]|jgi:hypothetical protein
MAPPKRCDDRSDVQLKDERMRPRLRLFVGADEQQATAAAEPEVSIRLEELTRILADAIIWDRSWIHDFGDDEVRISSDLFEVLSAYSQMRPSA